MKDLYITRRLYVLVLSPLQLFLKKKEKKHFPSLTDIHKVYENVDTSIFAFSAISGPFSLSLRELVKCVMGTGMQSLDDKS